MPLEMAPLQAWIGRTQARTDRLADTPVQGLRAMLDHEAPDVADGDAAPWASHWLYAFTPVPRQSEIGPDGHPKRGGFLPPVPLPRRMWAGSRLQFHGAPLRVGGAMTRHSTIADVSGKEGRSGTLVFVKVKHEITCDGAAVLTEEQDIVYRDDPRPGAPAAAPQPAPQDAAFSRTIEPTPTLLFRYSALTHNGHRIHYDRPYATGVEGYPGLVVHGPLIATLLLDLLHAHADGAALAQFAFRAVRPLHDDAPFRVCGRRDADGRTVRLWAEDAGGALAMDATATLA